MVRATVSTELGEEIQCARCEEFWPHDPEFFFYCKGKPHSWCKACYINNPKTLAKRERYAAKHATPSVAVTAHEGRSNLSNRGLLAFRGGDIFSGLLRPLNTVQSDTEEFA